MGNLIVFLTCVVLMVGLHPVSSQTGGCEPGWSRSPDKCFKLFGTAIDGATRLTWSQADEACKDMGALLATIPNAQTQPILTAILGQAPTSHAWIGLHDLVKEGSFVWSNGDPLDNNGFTNWSPNNPDNGQAGFEEDCVFLHADKVYPGEWYDSYCDYGRAYICEKPHDPVQPTLSPSIGCRLHPDKQYILFERACYMLDMTPRTFNESAEVCIDDTAEIASVENAFEEAFLEAMLLNAGETSAWLGLQTQPLVDNFVWSDDRPVLYTSWGKNRPASSKDCGILTNTGWEDETCDQMHPVLCKKSLVRDPPRPIPLRGSYCPDDRMIPLDDNYCGVKNETKCTQEEATAYCRDLHETSTLTSVHNLNENEQAIGGSLNPDETIWIGLQRSVRDNFLWDDGSVLDYVSFDDSPITDECVTMTRTTSTNEIVWKTAPCNETHGFFCRAPKIFSPPETGGCSPGWFQFTDRCFKAIGVEDVDRQVYADAESYCLIQGAGRGMLYKVNNQVRQSMLALLLEDFVGHTNLWIGLSDTHAEGEFVWSDGSPLGDFTNWAPNQPDGFTEIPTEPFRDCVEVKTDSIQLGKWDDINCLERRGFICETYLDTQLPTNDTLIFERCSGQHSEYTKYNDSCYLVINETLPYPEAKAMCNADGAWVTRARDGMYNSLLTLMVNVYLVNPQPIWLSLKQDNVDTYKWDENSGQPDWPFTYANWAKTMPSGDICTVLQDDSTWLNVPCNDQHYTVCEYTDTKPDLVDDSPVHCPDGFMLIERHCYKFDTLTTEHPQIHFTFTEAQLECQLRYNASLPGIHSQAANNLFRREAFTSLGDRNVWLGLHRSVDGYYTYADNRVVNYVHWSPDTSRRGSECVGMNTDSGYWDNLHCFAHAGLVCETEALPGEGNPCPKSWSLDSDSCYYVSDAADEMSWKSWNEAETWCNTNKGHLTTVEDGREKEFINNILYGEIESFWIGLNNIKTPGIWIWADGTSYDSKTAEWSPDDVRNENNMEYCVLINKNDEWEDHNCGIRRPFICKWNTNQEEPIVVTAAPLLGECAPGSYRLRDRCYDLSFMEEEKTWIDAHSYCLLHSGELAAIHDPAVQALLSTSLQSVKGNVWIGMSRYGMYDQYYWSDGVGVDFTNWALGEPNGPYQQEDNDNSIDYCVEMLNNPTNAGKWSDENCNKKNGFICEKSLDITQQEQPLPFQLCPGTTDYLIYKDSCFKIVMYGATNPNSAKTCEDEGGHLASIGDAYEQAFIEILLAYFEVESAWIGLKRSSLDRFEWVDGWPSVFTNWMAGYPTGSSNLNRCVVMSLNGWRNVDCYDAYHAVCKTTKAVKPSLPPPPIGTCPNRWIEFERQCYYFDTERKEVSFLEAYAFCQALGPDVFPASCHNSQGNTFLQETARSVLQIGNLWLGLLYQDEEFKWNDGAPVVYTNWRSGLPELPIEVNPCVQLDTEGAAFWKNVDCFTKAGYVCQSPARARPTVMPTTEQAQKPSKEPQLELSLEAIIGIAVGGGIVASVILIAFFCYFREKRRINKKRADVVEDTDEEEM